MFGAKLESKEVTDTKPKKKKATKKIADTKEQMPTFDRMFEDPQVRKTLAHAHESD